jgi:hypothetical protein
MLNIDPFYFFTSFAIGILLVYIITPPPQIVVKFPSPFNSGNLVYRDKVGTCYKYHANKVPCDTKGKQVLPQPILEDFKFREYYKNFMSKLETQTPPPS